MIFLSFHRKKELWLVLMMMRRRAASRLKVWSLDLKSPILYSLAGNPEEGDSLPVVLGPQWCSEEVSMQRSGYNKVNLGL